MACAGIAGRCSVHAVPFQCAVMLSPTAVQDVADGHDTWKSPMLAAPGTCCRTQLVPFQCSTSSLVWLRLTEPFASS